MTNHQESWFLMTSHQESWFLMTNHQESWFLMIKNHDYWWLIINNHDAWSRIDDVIPSTTSQWGRILEVFFTESTKNTFHWKLLYEWMAIPLCIGVYIYIYIYDNVTLIVSVHRKWGTKIQNLGRGACLQWLDMFPHMLPYFCNPRTHTNIIRAVTMFFVPPGGIKGFSIRDFQERGPVRLPEAKEKSSRAIKTIPRTGISRRFSWW